MRVRCALAVAAALGIAGCGEEEDHANGERPAASITVTAAIAGGAIEISPREFGAGPIRLLVSNQTSAAQELTFESGGGASGVTQTTAPIAPGGTGTLELDVTEGEYEIRAGGEAGGAGGGIEPAAVRVGAPRPSAQNDLLLP